MEAKKLSEDEAIRILNEIVSGRDAENAETGACIYNAGGKTYCAQLSQSNCNTLGGIWRKGEKCP